LISGRMLGTFERFFHFHASKTERRKGKKKGGGKFSGKRKLKRRLFG